MSVVFESTVITWWQVLACRDHCVSIVVYLLVLVLDSRVRWEDGSVGSMKNHFDVYFFILNKNYIK